MPIFPIDQFATFIMAATVGSFAVELVYLMLAVAMIWLLIRRGAKWWQYLVVADRDRDAGARLLRRARARAAQHDQLQLRRALLHAGVIALARCGSRSAAGASPTACANAAAHATEHHGVPALDENLDFTPAS